MPQVILIVRYVRTKEIVKSSRPLKNPASIVLASRRGSTGTRPPHHSAARTDVVLLIRRTVRPRGYASPLLSLRPCLRNGASWRTGVGWVRRRALLNNQLALLEPCMTSFSSMFFSYKKNFQHPASVKGNWMMEPGWRDTCRGLSLLH